MTDLRLLRSLQTKPTMRPAHHSSTKVVSHIKAVTIVPASGRNQGPNRRHLESSHTITQRGQRPEG